MVSRVSTGVKGLDKIVQGGFPQGSVILISGAPGTGKTIFGMQFLEQGVKDGEKCAYVTIEETPEKIMSQAEQFGLFKKAPEMISAQDVKYDIGWKKPDAVEDKIKLVLDKVAQKKVKRVVIDSVSSLSLEDGLLGRRITKRLVEGLNKLGVTAVIIGEALEGDFPDNVTPFLVDGVIVLQYMVVGSSAGRSLFIQKMRETKHSENTHPVEINKKGMVVKAAEDAYKV